SDPPGVGYLNRASTEIAIRYPDDPRGVFEAGARVLHRTNSLGYRGDEFPEPGPRPEGVRRLAFVGDSFTFGEGVRFADTYAERTAALLAAAWPGLRVEALNFGVGGYNTAQTRILTEAWVLPRRPDALVLGYTMSDVKEPIFERDPRSGKLRNRRQPPNRSAPSGWMRSLRVGRLLWSALARRALDREIFATYRDLYRENAPEWRGTSSELRALGARCAELPLGCFAVVFPVLAQLDDYPLEAEHQRVVEALAASGFVVADLLTLLAGREASELWVHRADHHPNEMVHALAARRLAKLIDEVSGSS
ncbi:MAG: GDSL-type esterase/lipase family protein, partial [Myxococcota bacterium]